MLFARTLTSNPDLAALVRTLELRPAIDASDHHAWVSEKEMSSVRSILDLKGLQKVTLGGNLAVRADRFLHALASSSTLVELNIDGTRPPSSGNAHLNSHTAASLEWDEIMAYRFPRLRQLRLSDVQLTIIPSLMPCPTRLTSLTLHNVDIADGVLSDLCHEAWDSLRVLTVTTKCPEAMDEHVRSLLDVCENLDTLQYDACETPGVEAFTDTEPSAGISLRELRLSGFDITPQSLASIGRICKGLRELSVAGRLVRVTPEDWATFLASGALPALQRLATPAGTCRPPFAHWSQGMGQQVQDACAARNVALVSSY
ncbi:hypothetical protein CERSUDRAFT_79376 [Gelatoporia subvermispora B]|uniref:F-box domain-containing protein n=1 Tax=Ceriporiopsis subvermispora (strain B) TaxID=914234 RepID=M2QX81_CERS8|nr:hypothetical protein CERSUDRAFT_79376 [Gelatoporia subvermispora B]